MPRRFSQPAEITKYIAVKIKGARWRPALKLIMNLDRVSVGKLEGKRQLGINIRRREDDMKMYLRKIGLGGMD
jgi:hypothetical protein